MSDTSRRKFLAAAGAGTAAAAAAVAHGGSAQAATPGATQRHRDAADEPVVAFVQHPGSDIVHLMVGEREVVVEDRELAARILNAAGRK